MTIIYIFFRQIKSIVHFLRNRINVFKANMHEGVIVSFSATIGNKTILEGYNKINEHVIFYGKIGLGSYIGNNSVINSAVIGRFTSIAPYVQVNCGRHPFKSPYVSTSPCFVSLLKQCGFCLTNVQRFDEVAEPVRIGNDCWIGQRAFISGGVVIGDGAVVLAHAAVVKDVPPYAIVGGVPAKIIGYRYDADTIQFLEGIKWWENDIHWLKQHIDIMTNIEELKKYYNEQVLCKELAKNKETES